MPIYEYKYLHPENEEEEKLRIEEIQGINDEPLTEINGRKVVRVPSTFSARYYGSGFYENDYKSKKIT